MRLLYIDIDCQRPDHLGCYGYHRDTSPNIDAVAATGVRFDSVYVSDSPCLPSRTALFSGRFGIHTGVVDQGGTGADMLPDGAARRFSSTLGRTSWMRCLRDRGLHTVTVSPFGERHSAWHFYASFSEIHNTGRRGLERADEIAPVALDWIARRGRDDGWFLHVNLWDVHTPYRAPDAAGARFAADPLPAWYGEPVRRAHWDGCGPHSAREAIGFGDDPGPQYRAQYPRQPLVIDSMDAARRMFDGYDAGVRYADEWIGRILDALRDAGVLDDTAVLISADHGEQLGELGVYADHHAADQHTNRVPLILRWPGVTDRLAGRALSALHYQVDVAATIVELLGGQVPASWDGASFAASLRRGDDAGRDALVLSQGAWSCQRAVRWRRDGRELLYLRTYHDGYHLWPDELLFDLVDDPHEQRDLAAAEPAAVADARARLADWHADMMRTATHALDPLDTVLAEGGPSHVRGQLPAYLARLRATGRAALADELERRHPTQAHPPG